MYMRGFLRDWGRRFVSGDLRRRMWVSVVISREFANEGNNKASQPVRP